MVILAASVFEISCG